MGAKQANQRPLAESARLMRRVILAPLPEPESSGEQIVGVGRLRRLHILKELHEESFHLPIGSEVLVLQPPAPVLGSSGNYLFSSTVEPTGYRADRYWFDGRQRYRRERRVRPRRDHQNHVSYD
jgi:hypothetical protein